MKLKKAIIRSIEHGVAISIMPSKTPGCVNVQGSKDQEEDADGVAFPIKVGKDEVGYNSIADTIEANRWKVLNSLEDESRR